MLINEHNFTNCVYILQIIYFFTPCSLSYVTYTAILDKKRFMEILKVIFSKEMYMS